MSDVYTTGFSGVGMRMRDSSGRGLVGTGQCATTSTLGTVASDGSFNVSGTFELVKTGPITSGAAPVLGQFSAGLFQTGVQLNNNDNDFYVAAGTVFRPPTCSVTSDTATQTVKLPPVSASKLPNAGAVAGTTPWFISINCDPNFKVSATLSSTQASSGIPSVLASNGSASGVGVQLLDSKSAPVTLGNALLLTSATTGNMSFQFYAQYYRLGTANVKGGTVQSSAVLTMSYQ